MGYETRLYVVESFQRNSRGRPIDYCSIIGSIDLCKVAYDKVGEVIKQAEHELDGKLSLQVKGWLDELRQVKEELRELTEENSNAEKGETIEKIELNRLQDKVFEIERKLAKRLPYIFVGNEKEFEDNYGCPLMVCELEEIYKAMVHDNAKMLIEDGNTYRRFDIAIPMIKGFIDAKKSFGKKLKVILWGY